MQKHKMENKQHLLPIPNWTHSLYDRLRAVTVSPRAYFAPSIKAILDERDSVKKTGFRVSKRGREYHNGIWMILSEARFEQVKSETEVSAAVLDYTEKLLGVAKRTIALERGDYEGLDRCEKEVEAITREAIPALQNGVLYDANGSLPIKASSDMADQRVYSVLIGYRPFHPPFPSPITELLAYSLLRSPRKSTLEGMMATLLQKPLESL